MARRPADRRAFRDALQRARGNVVDRPCGSPVLDDPLPAEDDEVADDDAPSRPSPAARLGALLGELTASDDDGPVSDAKKAAPLILGLLVLAVGFALVKKCCGCVAGLRGGSAPAQPYEKVPQVEMTARDGYASGRAF